MSVCRKLPDGTVQKIAGHTILLDANASEVREGTATFTPGAAMYYDSTVTFTDPMPDTDYIVLLETGIFPGMSEQMGQPSITGKTTTGFSVRYFCNGNPDSRGGNMHYVAWKPVKIEGYTALQNKVNNPDETPTIDSMNLVTSDGVARAIENASAVWKGTKAEWNALPAADKKKYDLAVLIDTQLIKSVDRTDGTDSDVADLTGKIFRGTEEEWNALSAAEKDEYEQAELRQRFYNVPRLAFGFPGFVQAFAGSADKVPEGWLPCDGTEYNVTDYPELYDVIGNIYGGTSGSTFKVPDYRGEFLRGADTNPTTGYSGSHVGGHQDGTPMNASIWHYAPNGQVNIRTYQTDSNVPNMDKTQMVTVWDRDVGVHINTLQNSIGVVRPTNTSVNWIIHV